MPPAIELYACFYTEADLGGELGGMIELKTIAQYGRVFIEWDTFLTVWRNNRCA